MSTPIPAQRVLIVDDEADLLQVLGELFSLFGYEVESAGDGARAWEMMQASRFDVVLTDVRMPVMDGLALIRRIRAADRLRPIVMVTSGYTDHTPEVLYDAGANGFLAKPFGASGVRDAFVLASTSPERRWSTARTGGRHPLLERTMIDLEREGELRLGTGGLFWGLEGPAPRVGDIIDFHVRRPGNHDWRGQGVVRWSRGQRDDLPPGCGIEFTYLDEGCRAEVIARIEAARPTAYLPRR